LLLLESLKLGLLIVLDQASLRESPPEKPLRLPLLQPSGIAGEVLLGLLQRTLLPTSDKPHLDDHHYRHQHAEADEEHHWIHEDPLYAALTLRAIMILSQTPRQTSTAPIRT
jgi:hypothetical protein